MSASFEREAGLNVLRHKGNILKSSTQS